MKLAQPDVLCEANRRLELYDGDILEMAPVGLDPLYSCPMLVPVYTT